MSDLPPITQQIIQHVDGTPNAGYVLRILKAYRENCNCRWDAIPPSPIFDAMNRAQVKRAKLLDEAIAKMEGGEDET